jgi:integrase
MTGMRIGEALALHWDDMSLDTGRVHIHRNLVRYTAKAWEFVPPKTDSGDRHIILDSMALDAMKAHREQSPAGHALVFAQADGTPIYHTNVGRAMRPERSAPKALRRSVDEIERPSLLLSGRGGAK